MPSLLRVAAAGCVSASSHLHRLQHLATGPAAAVASAVQSPAQPPPYSQPISAATAATSEQKAKRPIKQPRWNERTQTGGLAVGSYTRRNRASALLVSFAPASVHTRRLLEHGDVVRLGSRAIQDYTALPAAGRAEGLSRQNPRWARAFVCLTGGWLFATATAVCNCLSQTVCAPVYAGCWVPSQSCAAS